MSGELTRLLQPYAPALNAASIESMALRVLGAALVLLAGFWLSRLLQRLLLRRGMQSQDTGAPEVIETYRRFIRTVVAVIAVAVALHTLGVHLSPLFTTGGLLAVAAAFAMKNVSENLIAGWILRAEQVIKRGDVLRIGNGEMVRVKRIGLRATIVRTKSEADLIMPNAELVQNDVYNHTHGDALFRLETLVGVAYSSDLRQVRAVLEEVTDRLDWRSRRKDPQIALGAFGDSSVNYRAMVWIEDPWSQGGMLSKLNEAIWWALHDARIVIALPQLDVHVVSSPTAGDQGEGHVSLQ